MKIAEILVISAILLFTSIQSQTANLGNIPKIVPDGTDPNNFLPPLDRPLLTPALNNITDAYMTKLQPILSLFPPYEQDVIAKCFYQNNDTSRLVDPDCFKSVFPDIKTNSAQGISGQLTNNSKTIRNSLGCLSKVTQNYATANDSASTTISTEMSNIVSQQTTLNNCAAVFIKATQEILNTRRRFVLTTKANIDASIVKDSTGAITGFIFSSDEQTTLVKGFKTYADCLNSFFSSMSTSVIGVQALIGQLNNCKPPQNPQSNPTLLPSGGNTNSTFLPGTPIAFNSTTAGQQPPQPAPQPPQNQNGFGFANGTISFDSNGKPIFPTPDSFKTQATTLYQSLISKNIASWTFVANKINSAIDQKSSSNTYKNYAPIQNMIIDKIDNSDWIKKEFDKGVRQDDCASDYLFYCSSGTCNCLETGCPAEIAGVKTVTMRARPNVQITSRLLQIAPSGSQPTGNQPPGPQTNGTQPNGTRPNNNTQPNGNQTPGTQPNNTQPNGNQPPGPQPNGNQPPGPQPNNTQPNGNQPQKPSNGNQPNTQPSGSGFAPPVKFNSQTDDVLSYYIAEACFSGKRFIYAEATQEISGQSFDLITTKPGNGMGQAVAKQFNDCSKVLQQGTQDDKKNCRGPIQDDCANAMDGTCKKSGLYDMLVNHPQTSSPYPDSCNNSLSNYNEANCLTWIIKNLLKASVVFDYKNFDKLPKLIGTSIQTSSSSLRLLQVSTDPTSSDTKAKVDGTLSNSAITVDSATATTIPDANIYVKDLNTITIATTLSSSFLKFGSGLALTVIFAIFL